jgi:hypothetical protein
MLALSVKRRRLIGQTRGPGLIRGSTHQANRVAAVPLVPFENAPFGVQFVVGIQHPTTTFFKSGVTPKKSADACLFCFPSCAAGSSLPKR